MPKKKKRQQKSCIHCGLSGANSATHCKKCDKHHSKSKPCPGLPENQCARAAIINANEPTSNSTTQKPQPRKKLRKMITSGLILFAHVRI